MQRIQEFKDSAEIKGEKYAYGESRMGTEG